MRGNDLERQNGGGGAEKPKHSGCYFESRADRASDGLDGVGEESRMTTEFVPLDGSLGWARLWLEGEGEHTEFCFGAF